MSDPWEGIPQELREVEVEIEAALQRYAEARSFWSTGDQHRDYIMTRLRSLVSRLREAERAVLQLRATKGVIWNSNYKGPPHPLLRESFKQWKEMHPSGSSGETPTP